MQQSLDKLDALSEAPLSTCDEQPVFLLALSWGSGSTLLQRILMTDPSLLLWGEPYGRMGLLPGFTRAVDTVTDKWPRERFFRARQGDELVTDFVANHYPPPNDMLEAYRDMILRMFAQPAERRGFQRWGLKEVRLAAPDAVLLAKLFPQARFIVLVRDPYRCYRSSKNMRTMWRYDAVVDDVTRFATLWSDMAKTWVDAPASLPHRVVRYEDLANGDCDFRTLEAFAGLRLNESKALTVRAGQRGSGKTLGRRDRRTIRRIAGPVMKALGYEP